MEAELIQLLKFADEAIGRYITFYMTGMAALAILVMTENYKKNFKPVGKIILSITLLGLAFGNWYIVVYYHEIYNATITAIQNSMTTPDLDYLFGPENGALQDKPMWNVHVGHIMGGIIGLSLVWWTNIQTTCRMWLLNRINRLRHLGKR